MLALGFCEGEPPVEKGVLKGNTKSLVGGLKLNEISKHVCVESGGHCKVGTGPRGDEDLV